MFVLLALVFFVAPVIELYVIVQVAGGIGVPETILLLIAISVAGVWWMKVAGLGVLNRLQRTVRAGKVPSAELVDGGLVLLAGALLILPGFLSDAVAVLLLLPPSRAVARGIVLARLRAHGGLFTVMTRVPMGPDGTGSEIWDVDSWEDPPERPVLGP